MSLLKEKLDEAKILYEVYTHVLAYTAQEVAARQHVSGNELGNQLIDSLRALPRGERCAGQRGLLGAAQQCHVDLKPRAIEEALLRHRPNGTEADGFRSHTNRKTDFALRQWPAVGATKSGEQDEADGRPKLSCLTAIANRTTK